MQTPNHLKTITYCVLFGLLTSAATFGSETSSNPPAESRSMPLDGTALMVGQTYSADVLGVMATSEGALLRCRFQKLEGEATHKGL